MMQRCKKTLWSSNQAFKHANSHLKHLEAKISQYSYHTYVIIIIIFFIIILFMLKKKNGDYAGIMLDGPTIALCPKLCRHNASNPNLEEAVYGYPFNFYATGSWYLGDWAWKRYWFIYFFFGY